MYISQEVYNKETQAFCAVADRSDGEEQIDTKVVGVCI